MERHYFRSSKGETVIGAPNKKNYKPTQEKDCPFCDSGREVTMRGEPTEMGQAIITPNAYPLAENHYLILDTQEHVVDYADLSEEEAYESWNLIQKFLRAHPEQYWYVFRNQGPLAGGSKEHIHGQILEYPDKLPRHYLKPEQETVQLIELEFTKFTIPKHAKIPHTLWLEPLKPNQPFRDLTPGQLREISTAIRSKLWQLKKKEVSSWNLILHTYVGGWVIEICPRITTLCGLHLATDAWINNTLPEEAQAFWHQEEE